MIIKDKQNNKWTVHAITDNYYHVHDDRGNIDFVNLKVISVAFKVENE